MNRWMSSGKNRIVFTGVVLAILCGSSCQQQINYPAPVVSGLAPANANAGQPAFTITVTGSHLTPATTVLWNGSPRVSFFQDEGHITADILQIDVENPGKAQVTVTTPQPGGGTFQPALDFTINPVAVPQPSITSMSPTTVNASSGAFTLRITGRNFVSTSIATVNGQNRTTIEENSTLLDVAVPAADITSAGTLQVAVINPPVPNPPAGTAPGGGSSNVVSFSITNPAPQISDVTPNAAGIGASATQITVTGLGLVPGSVVTINGSPRTTAFSGSGTVSAILTAGDLAIAGVDRIQVFNPSPGGGTSNSLPFGVAPSLTQGLPVLIDYGVDGSVSNSGICGDASTCASATPTNGIPSLSTAGPAITTSAASVAYASISSNLVANQATSGSQIFVTVPCVGSGSLGACLPTTSVASVGPGEIVANGPSTEPSISGSDVVFTSLATDLTNYIAVTGSHRQVYWEPICTTAATCNGAVLVSLGADGLPGNGDSYDASISPDGQFVAFVSLATNLVTNVSVDGITPQVYIRTICSGALPNGTTLGGGTTGSTTCTPTTYLVSSADGATPGNAPSAHPSVASGGGYVAFQSTANNLGPAAPNPGSQQEIFVQQVCQILTVGCTSPFTTLVSTAGGGGTPADKPSTEPAISSDGRFVAFASTSTNLGFVANSFQQVFVRDTCNSTGASVTGCAPSTKLVSTQDGSTPGNGLSESPSIGDSCTSTTTTCTVGPVIAFASAASTLGPNVASGVENIYARNVCLAVPSGTSCTPSTTLVSVPAGISPAPSNGNSIMPSISSDGHAVAFLSAASNLVPTSTGSGLVHVYVGSTSF